MTMRKAKTIYREAGGDIDVVVHNNGTVFSFELVTDAARTWVDENVESEGYQWFGDRLVVDHGMAAGLADGMLGAGLGVE